MSSFTASQIACLKGLELSLWQLNSHHHLSDHPSIKDDTGVGVSTASITTATEENPVRDGTNEQSPGADEIRRALRWCQKAGRWSGPLEWRINPAQQHCLLTDNLLQTPDVEVLMASAALKRQLWQLLISREL